MVKLLYMTIMYKHDDRAVSLKSSKDLSTFGFFQRASINEFLRFTAKTLVERTDLSQRIGVREEAYFCHVYIRNDRLAGVIVSDFEYPQRVAQTLLTKVLDEFTSVVPMSSWSTAAEDSIEFKQLDQYLARYQNPEEADPMTKLQKDLDETKIILHRTMESALHRGEKLEDLVAKSDVLSQQSKLYFKTARKTNQCCQYL